MFSALWKPAVLSIFRRTMFSSVIFCLKSAYFSETSPTQTTSTCCRHPTRGTISTANRSDGPKLIMADEHLPNILTFLLKIQYKFSAQISATKRKLPRSSSEIFRTWQPGVPVLYTAPGIRTGTFKDLNRQINYILCNNIIQKR